jgi:BMFP domain-containing protein YqiC
LRPRRTIAIVSDYSKRAGRGNWRGFASKAFRQQGLEAIMVQTTNRFFDEVARLMNDAAGVAQGVRREFETLFRTQAERWLRDLDLVKREDFEAVKDMARLAREENDALKGRVAALEAAVAKFGTETTTFNAPPSYPSAGGTAMGDSFPSQGPGGPSGQIDPGTF